MPQEHQKRIAYEGKTEMTARKKKKAALFLLTTKGKKETATVVVARLTLTEIIKHTHHGDMFYHVIIEVFWLVYCSNCK